MMWSSSGTPSTLPASMMTWVMAISSRLGLGRTAWMVVHQHHAARADANQRTKHVAGGQRAAMCATRGEHELFEDVVSSIEGNGQHHFMPEIAQACRVDRRPLCRRWQGFQWARSAKRWT